MLSSLKFRLTLVLIGTVIFVYVAEMTKFIRQYRQPMTETIISIIEDGRRNIDQQKIQSWRPLINRSTPRPPIVCQPRRTKAEKPINSTFFYALHKTGSTKMRNVIRNHCIQQRLSCFAPEIKGDHYCSSSASWCQRYIDHMVNYGTTTWKRLLRCCAKSVDQKFDMIFGHTQMNDRETKDWVWRSIKGKKPFVFTIVRDPVDQFESYFHNLPHYQFMEGKSLNKLVDILYAYKIGKTEKLGRGDAKWWHFLVNSQSKEMGWDGKSDESFGEVINSVNQLDFIAPTGQLREGLQILQHQLGWPRKLFDESFNGGRMKKYKHSGDTRRKIIALQDRDMILYRAAQEKFNTCFKQEIKALRRRKQQQATNDGTIPS